jgi:hypothetical protein
MPLRTCLLALALSAGAAAAQIAPPPAPPAPQVPDLSGPQVQPQAAEATLIRQSLDTGMIIRLETTPEEAALDLVGLTPQEREAVDKVLTERGAVLDKIVADNLPKLLKFQGLRQSDTPKERMQALTELARAMQPMEEYSKSHGTLLRQVSALIAPEKAAKVQQLVGDYRRALMAEADATYPQDPRHDTPEKRQSALRGRELLLSVGADLRRSYDRQIAAKTAALNDLIAKLNLTPQQEGQVRTYASDFAQLAAASKPTPEQRREFFQKVFTVLDDNQKLAMLSALYGVAPVNPPAPSARPSTGSEPPEPISDEQIATLNRQDAMREWSNRQSWIQKNPKADAEVHNRLRVEAEKCKQRMQQAGSP